MTRRILIDDTDPGITYTGPWFADRGSQDTLGNFGLTYQHTLHGTTSDASLSYTFQGTVIGITGTQQYQDTTAVTNPSWECIVDGKSIAVQTYSYANNRLLLCSLFDMADGVHTIVVNVHVKDNRTFWFDHLTYQPSASVPLDNAAITVEVPEPEMHFGTGWEQFASGYETSVTGSTFTFDFHGISLTWYGSYDAQFPFAATTATYTVDGGTPISFNLNGVAATRTAVQYNQVFFTTPTYPPGVHSLQVTYQGNKDTTPLALQFIIIQNGTSTTTTSTSTSSSSLSSGPSSSGNISPSNSANTNPNHRKSDIAPIAGGVVGGLLLIVGAILLWLFLRRRKRCLQLQEAEELDPASPNHGFISPYPLDSSSHLPPTAENRPNTFGNPVVGKRNIAQNEAREAGQSLENLRGNANHSYASYPNTSSKSRLVGNLAAANRSNPSSSTANSSETPSNPSSSAGRSQPGSSSNPRPSTSLPDGSSSPRIVRDEDSGIRMRQTDQGQIMVLPPLYTAS